MDSANAAHSSDSLDSADLVDWRDSADSDFNLHLDSRLFLKAHYYYCHVINGTLFSFNRGKL